MSKKIAVIGARGFVGSVMCEVARESGFELLEVTRDNYEAATNTNGIDFVVNSAMPSGRFAAKNNPRKDFDETVAKTFTIKNDFNESQIVQISSISARLQLDTVYGRHKLAAEGLLDPARDLTIRLGPLYHDSLAKGALIDIVNDRPVYVSIDTKYAFTPVKWACQTIVENLHRSGVLEVGAKGFVRLGDLAQSLGSSSEFSGAVDDQVFPQAGDDSPDALDVVAFAKLRMNSGDSK